MSAVSQQQICSLKYDSMPSTAAKPFKSEFIPSLVSYPALRHNARSSSMMKNSQTRTQLQATEWLFEVSIPTHDRIEKQYGRGQIYPSTQSLIFVNDSSHEIISRFVLPLRKMSTFNFVQPACGPNRIDGILESESGDTSFKIVFKAGGETQFLRYLKSLIQANPGFRVQDNATQKFIYKMADFLDQEHIFNYPFPQVLSAWVRKDSHPKMDFLTEWIPLERYVNEKGELVTWRLLESSFLFFTGITGLEYTVFDRENQKLTYDTIGLRYTSIVEFKESSVIQGDKDKWVYTSHGTADYVWWLGVFIEALKGIGRKCFRLAAEAVEDIIQNNPKIPKQIITPDLNTKFKTKINFK